MNFPAAISFARVAVETADSVVAMCEELTTDVHQFISKNVELKLILNGQATGNVYQVAREVLTAAEKLAVINYPVQPEDECKVATVRFEREETVLEAINKALTAHLLSNLH